MSCRIRRLDGCMPLRYFQCHDAVPSSCDVMVRVFNAGCMMVSLSIRHVHGAHKWVRSPRYPKHGCHVNPTPTLSYVQTMYHLFKSIYLHATSKEGNCLFVPFHSYAMPWLSPSLMPAHPYNRILRPPPGPRQRRQNYAPRTDKSRLHTLASKPQNCAYCWSKRCNR
jgi:hypothetical protein